ncbi:hypothetical protein LSAT2_027305, partial [Lamellibrachia satsuma]
MPPAKSSCRRPARQQQPTDRHTRSRTAAGRPATRSTGLPAALGAPQHECTVQQDFDDAPGLQVVLLDDAAFVRRAWEHDMERRMASSERMLHAIHSMALALQPTPAAQLAAATAHGLPAPATSGAVSDVASLPNY